ncbi:MAG TPA: NAD(P)H-hydrate dehydratase [Kiritimatiellia bacterium]|nr:NAD(P)H-hydrate dehydratase [Kiritimatiellia bacterium]HMP97673.1 NAD(P)H-hydrate dehydratase [Kiritimatiellia bacterium]
MIPVTTAQMRELDRRAIEEFEIKGEALMERAGGGVASIVRRVAEIAGFMNPVVHLIAGRGQNGGDVFVAARVLKEQGLQVEVWIAGHINQISGDALIHYGRMKSAGVEAYEIPTLEDWQDMIDEAFYAEIVVDGVLGTGLKGPARGPAAGAIQYIRDRARDSLVISIDLPSGLNGDTGIAEGDVVLADITATIGFPKIGLLSQSAVDAVGSLDVIDIGHPEECLEELTASGDLEFVHASDLKPLFPRRRRSAHKGDFGHVLVVGGSRRHTGAAALAARSALRIGAGLVTALTPERLQSAVACDTPELMVWPGLENARGSLAAENLEAVLEQAAMFNAVVVGPGLTVDDDTRALVHGLLKHLRVPLVLDADALSMFAGCAAELAASEAALVLTPHPGELARLLGVATAEIQRDRLAAVRQAVTLTRAVVVLKGAGTLIAAEDAPVQVNLNGNPGMATAGSGDVLAGMIGGLLAQGFSPYNAARAGVYTHGRAGDYGAWRRCQAGLLAGDIVEELPYALRDLAIR